MTTTTRDVCGMPLTLGQGADEPRALEAWNGLLSGFLAHSAQTPVQLAATLEAAPRCAMAHVTKGFFLLLLGRAELEATAVDALTVARMEAPHLTSRERGYVDALALYVDGEIAAAADKLEEELGRTPEDALGFKLVHALRFVLGDASGMRQSAERAIGAYRGHVFEGYATGCLAFALEETGSYLAAEAAGRAAFELRPDDAWGLHAVAHVLDMTGRADEGVAWLGERSGAWAHCNNFGYHVWWHLALFHLDRGEIDATLRLYDEEIRAEHTDDYRDISNAASLLVRLECEGVDVGNRWDELAEICAKRTEDGCVVFADLHYMLALGAGDRPVENTRLLRALQSSAKTQRGSQSLVAAATGAPFAEGLVSFAHGDYAAAFEMMRRAEPQLSMIGGSHAQRDVFGRIAIEAALRAGLLDDAEHAILARARRRGARDGYSERRLSRISELRANASTAAE